MVYKGKSNTVKLGLLNARSLNTGRDELTSSIESYNIDILAVNETWIRENEDQSGYHIPGFKFYHAARPGGRRGGGTAFYVRQEIPSHVIDLQVSPVEQLWISVKLKTTRCILGTVYRPPGDNCAETLNSVNDTLSQLTATSDNIFLMGDFNINFLNPSDQKTKDLKAILETFSLDQIVTRPTRISTNSDSLLDLVCTNAGDKINKVEIIHNDDLSDHALILVTVNSCKTTFVPEHIITRYINRIPQNDLDTLLQSVPWQLICSMNEVDSMVDTFNKHIMQVYDTLSPKRRKIVRHVPKPWITDVIKIMMRIRDRACSRAKRTKRSEHFVYYKACRNMVTESIRREKRAYFAWNINDTIKNTKLCWSNIKKTISPKQATIIPPHLNIPNLLNSKLLEVPKTPPLDPSFRDSYNTRKHSSYTFEFTPSTEKEVRRHIMSIKSNAEGQDEITIQMLKLTLPISLPTITAIINKSLKTSVFPTCWKTAIVCPIAKIPKPCSFKDLRPISIIPALSKVLEKVVYTQLSSFLQKHSILPECQSGFRSNHSTTTAMLCVKDDILAATDAGKATALVLLDYSKAFDCLNISLLLAKLAYYGLSNAACSWMESYLTGRHQKVKCNNLNGVPTFSSSLPINRGVPQGTILSPLLFTIYTADLPQSITYCSHHMYADDTQIYMSFEPSETIDASRKITYDLNKIGAWSRSHCLALNPTKSSVVILGTKHKIKLVSSNKFELYLNQEKIPQVTVCRSLGLLLDSNFNFENHVQKKASQCYYKLKTFYMIREFLSTDIRKLLTETLILTHFDYGDSVYGPCLHKKNQQVVQRVQNACLRFCFNIPRRYHVTPYYVKHSILKMHDRRKLHMACMLKKIIICKIPWYLYRLLHWAGNNTGRNAAQTRGTGSLLLIPRHQSRAMQGSFAYTASKIWNDIPPPIKELALPAFKQKYKSLLTNQQALTV